jgi:hypothetical protein
VGDQGPLALLHLGLFEGTNTDSIVPMNQTQSGGGTDAGDASTGGPSEDSSTDGTSSMDASGAAWVGKNRLVYVLDVKARGVAVLETVFVDAHTGRVVSVVGHRWGRRGSHGPQPLAREIRDTNYETVLWVEGDPWPSKTEHQQVNLGSMRNEDQ